MRLSTVIALVLAVLLIFSSLAYWGYQTYENSQVSEENTGTLMKEVNDEQRIQLLLMHTSKSNLELVYLFSYDSISGRFAAIYLPPELRIMSPAYGEAMTLSELYEQFSASELTKELSSALQLDVPYWIRSKDEDLSSFIDMLGGISITFPNSGSGASNSKNNRVQWMDGVQIQQYVQNAYDQFRGQGRRFRHKTFFLGLQRKISQNSNLVQDQRTIERCQRIFKNNLSRSDWETLTHIFTRLEKDKVKFPSSLHLLRTGSEDNTLSPKPLKNMLPKPLKKMIDQADSRGTIDVQVLNGSGINELAGTVRDKIQPDPRVDVVEVGNADRYNYETTQIIDRRNNPESADHIHDILGTGSIQSNPSDKLLVDVTVITGRDLKHLVRPESAKPN